MKPVFKELTRDVLLIAVFLIVLGAFLIFMNTDFLAGAIRVVGYLMIAVGVAQLIRFLFFQINQRIGTLVFAILSGLVGYSFVHDPQSIIDMATVLVGIVLIISGFLHLRTAFIYRSYQFPRWRGTMFYAIMILIAGLFFLFYPAESVQWTLRICGFFLILEGCAILLGTYSFQNFMKEEPTYIEGDYTETDDE